MIPEQDDLLTAVNEIVDSDGGYAEALEYFNGDIEEVFATPFIRSLLRQTRLRHPFVVARTPVTSMAARLRLAGVTGADDAQTRAVDDLRTRERMPLLEPYLEERALTFGDCYALVWPDEDTGRATIRYRSPRLVRMVYEDGNPLGAMYAINRWRVGNRWRADLYYPDYVMRWISLPDVRDGCDAADWIPFSDDGADPELANEYGALPFFHFRTGLPHGRPVHADAMGPQDAINKLLSLVVVSADEQGWPYRYELVDPKGVLDQNGNDPDWDDDAEGAQDVGALGRRTSRRGGPGVVDTLQGITEVGQLEPGASDNLTGPVEQFFRVAAQATTTPLHYFSPQGDAPSGESLRAADAPAVDLARSIQRLYGATYSDMYEFALRIDGIEGASVACEWAPLVRIDDAAGWEAVQARQTAGVPADVTLREAGYTESQVRQWAGAQPGDLSLTRRIELIGQVGGMAADFAAAGDLIDQGAARDVLGSLLAELAAGGGLPL